MADSEVVRVMRAFQRQLAARDAVQMAQMAKHWVGVQDRLETNIYKLAKQIAEKYVTGTTVSR